MACRERRISDPISLINAFVDRRNVDPRTCSRHTFHLQVLVLQRVAAERVVQCRCARLISTLWIDDPMPCTVAVRSAEAEVLALVGLARPPPRAGPGRAGGAGGHRLGTPGTGFSWTMPKSRGSAHSTSHSCSFRREDEKEVG